MTTTDKLAAFDAAIAAELPRVYHLEYDSHEICKHFAGKVRERLLAAHDAEQAAKAVPALYVGLIERLMRLSTRLGIAYEGGVEHFAASLEDRLYAICRGAESLLNSVATPPAPEAQRMERPTDGQLSALLKEARKIIRASSSRNLAKDWDRRATQALAGATAGEQHGND